MLIVGDQQNTREFVYRALRQDGFKVRFASSGSDAVEVVNRFRQAIHAVVSDVEISDMSGVELAAEIRRTNPEVPILLVSDTAVEGHLKMAAVLNATLRLVERPLTPRSLNQA